MTYMTLAKSCENSTSGRGLIYFIAHIVYRNLYLAVTWAGCRWRQRRRQWRRSASWRPTWNIAAHPAGDKHSNICQPSPARSSSSSVSAI